MKKTKRIPYGISDFVSVREQNQYYVDKTKFIPVLEDMPSNLFFIRPRRFGKSLLLSMLRAYYDVGMKDRFHSLFDGLWIGTHPTPLQGGFQVLYLDFSRAGGTSEELAKNFYSYCNICLNNFMTRYDSFYDEKIKAQFFATDSTVEKLNLLQSEAKYRGHHLYLIVDEYDNFTNVVLNEKGEEVYHVLTHASGFYREVFKKFKDMFDRIFITGVSPVTLDDLTSGFNIGWNVTTEPSLNELLGFSTEDVRTMFTYYKEQGWLSQEADVEKIIKDMKPWYDNYCFAVDCLDKKTRMFNSDMVLYYLQSYIMSGKVPERMIDPNTRIDYGMIKKLIRFDGDRKEVLRKITLEGQIVTKLLPSFPPEDIIKAPVFSSLLFYYGMLTMVGRRGNRLILGIPNNNVRKQYYGYLLDEYQDSDCVNLSELRMLFTKMAFDGQWEEAFRFIANAYKENSSVRSSIEGERNLQGFFTAYLSVCGYYLTAPEVELAHGYCDFFLLPDLTHYASKHSYIVELKYLPKKDYALKADTQWKEAVEQIHCYAKAPRVDQLRQGTQLHCLVLQFAGWELERIEEV